MARSVIAYDKDLPEISGRLPWLRTPLGAWPQVDFNDDRDGCLFTATVHRKPVEELTLVISLPGTSGETSGKMSGKNLTALKQDGNLTIPDLASMIGVTERSIERNMKNCRNRNGCGPSD
jgi:ATP-dependent DNA helicase RecG